eukprot:1073533-Pelagomonas_calceolata.AAC.1
MRQPKRPHAPRKACLISKPAKVAQKQGQLWQGMSMNGSLAKHHQATKLKGKKPHKHQEKFGTKLCTEAGPRAQCNLGHEAWIYGRSSLIVISSGTRQNLKHLLNSVLSQSQSQSVTHTHFLPRYMLDAQGCAAKHNDTTHAGHQWMHNRTQRAP